MTGPAGVEGAASASWEVRCAEATCVRFGKLAVLGGERICPSGHERHAFVVVRFNPGTEADWCGYLYAFAGVCGHLVDSPVHWTPGSGHPCKLVWQREDHDGHEWIESLTGLRRDCPGWPRRGAVAVAF